MRCTADQSCRPQRQLSRACKWFIQQEAQETCSRRANVFQMVQMHYIYSDYSNHLAKLQLYVRRTYSICNGNVHSTIVQCTLYSVCKLLARLQICPLPTPLFWHVSFYRTRVRSLFTLVTNSLGEGSHYQIGWTFGRIPNDLWPPHPPHFWKIMLQIFIVDMVAYMQGGMWAR